MSDDHGGASGAVTPGLVCSHHHLYSALARGMPAPPRTPTGFVEILEQVWWRLDTALDAEMIEWSAKLGALEALESGCTAIIDHHESPSAIDGSLSIIADACAEVGVRVSCAYGVTDRHGPAGAAAGLAENERYLRAGGRGMVGVHAAFTCEPATLDAAAGLAADLGVGVHVHVAEGAVDAAPGAAFAARAEPSWLLVHGVHLPDGFETPATVVHNPRSNLNNAVGYAHPTRFDRVALGTDGIGADMLEEFRLAYVAHRAADVTVGPDTAWSWLATGWDLFPEARADRVRWSYDSADPWRLAYTTGVRAVDVDVDGTPTLVAGRHAWLDGDEIRAKAAEHATRLFARL